MLLQDCYKNGFQRQPFTAYGIELQPLTLGHIQLLHEVECSAIYPDGEITFADIVLICAVCSFSMWEQSRDVIMQDDKHLNQIAAHCYKNKSSEQNQIVIDYVCYYLAKPMCNNAVDYNAMRVPWWWSYAEFLQSELGRSERDSWDTICCDAFSYYASFATRNGSSDFLTQTEVYLSRQFAQGKTVKDLFEEGAI